jgi:hypothetical protein
MKVNRDFQGNVFQKGMKLDASDAIMPIDTIRFGQNVRMWNRSGSSYVLTNLPGTESLFTLTEGFVPVATQEFNGVLYIVSWHTDGRLEVGSFPSPDYATPLNPSGNSQVYRAFNNFDGGAFRTSALGTATKPVIQKLEIQPDYDESVNLLFTIVGSRPRIVNSKFKALHNGTEFSILPDRSTTASTAASNTYTASTVNKETSMILFSQKILKVDLQGITAGGKLKCGNYTYVFYYMTEDFNRTSIIGQSSVCQIAIGDNVSSMRGGDETEFTNKRVQLRLSNVDTDFRYVKAYAMYSSGQEALEEQYLEFTQPLSITGTTVDFFHTGFEEVVEVNQSEVNIDYASIESAAASTQVGGYYFLADVRQRVVEFSELRSRTFSGTLPSYRETSLAITGGFPGYCNPVNVYNSLGYMSGETYPYGIVYIMTDGSLSPVFPIKGCDIKAAGDGVLTHVYSSEGNNKGLVTYPFHHQKPVYDEVNQALKIKSITLNVASLQNDSYIQENTLGFFIVRGERRPNALTQGVLLPTIKAPTIEASDSNPNNQEGYGANTDTGGSGAGGYYVTNGANQDDINVFKHLINLDCIVEAFLYNGWSEGADTVINENNGISSGYMPVQIMVDKTTYDVWETDPVKPYIFRSKSNSPNLRHWALISGEALVNEAEFITALQRENMGIHQIAKLKFLVTDQITPVRQGDDFPIYNFGCHYQMSGYHTIYTGSNKPTPKGVSRIVYVPAESLATGTDFISKLKVALLERTTESNTSRHFWINQWFNSYFGIKIADTESLVDSIPGVANPIGSDLRPGKTLSKQFSDGTLGYSNLGRSVPAAFLVNIYPQGTILSPDDLYQSVDNVVYRQISQRYTWADVNALGNQVPVFGGDCFISKVSRKLNHAPERNSSTVQTEQGQRWNIDSGMIITWWQESKYNLHLRQPKQYDATELEKRSFYPYQSLGNAVAYRKYRLPETKAHSPGYAVITPPKSFFGISPQVPFEQTRFMSRIYHSEKHIPNVFRNGYRSFLETAFRDYDTGMGSIVAMFNHRGNLLVIFEHGVGITSVEQRVETARDAGGSIVIEPTTVLPPTLTYLTREIGCQDTLSLVQTPGAVYGMDRSKHKIWRMADKLEVISDRDVSSWLIDNPAVNPRAGYDFEYGEALFITDNWTLVFLEDMGQWTSFYTYASGQFFARLNKNLFSFVGKTAYKHNVVDSYTIYGQQQDVIVEMVVNKAYAMTKVMDYIEIISNEVPPVKVEIFSYNQIVSIGATIDSAALNQYTAVDAGLDLYTEEEKILYRDKKYVVQIPYRTGYNPGTSSDKWSTEGRIRDKAVIVRLTYRPDKPMELVSVLNYFRYSPS